MHVLLAGVTTRALAGSAARAGYRVTAVDAFGDLDLRATADVVALTRGEGGFRPAEAVRVARLLPSEAVAYTSSFENHPDAVAALAEGRELLGNPADVLRRVRRPIDLMRRLAGYGFRVPRTRASAPRAPGATGAWLLKTRRSGGGRGVSVWRANQPVGRSRYLQERIRGTPGSIVFLADGRGCLPLGLTRQLVGEPAFGAHHFGYCGSLLGASGPALFVREAELRARAGALAAAVVEEYGLIGLNGIDFIARDGIPYPLEVNPRVCASMELVERLGGPLLFPLHVAACRERLPASLPAAARAAVAGKAVVFARRAVVAPDLTRLGPDLADVPHPGERIGRGRPICTVFATARTAGECVRALAARARGIYALIEHRAVGAA